MTTYEVTGIVSFRDIGGPVEYTQPHQLSEGAKPFDAWTAFQKDIQQRFGNIDIKLTRIRLVEPHRGRGQGPP
jgi:hypothetical protein